MDWIRLWWRQPDHYQWLSDYLAAHKLMTFAQYMMAAIVATLGVPHILMLWSPAGPHGPAERATSIAIAAGCGVMALLWATRWPSRSQSSLFAIVSTLAIAITCLVTAPGTGMQSCTAFAALAGYVAFFHTARHLLFTLSVAVVTATTSAAEIALQGDPLQAVSKLLVLFNGILAVPFCVQVMVHTLGIDALSSDVDSLTELPNRRGFSRSVLVLATESSRDIEAHLTFVMVDLDDFKRVNDTAGHAAGDQTLVAVGDILRRSRPGGSVVGRVGGEEFVVAMAGDRRDAIALAEHVRREIAKAPSRVTASIGVASTSLYRMMPQDVSGHVDGLLESADRAMYKAKRSGGNRVHVIGWPSDTTTERDRSGADVRRTVTAVGVEPSPGYRRSS